MKICIPFLFIFILVLGACAVTQTTPPTPIIKETTISLTAPKYNVGDEWTFRWAQGAPYILKVVEIGKDSIVTTRSDTNCRQYRDGHFTITRFSGDACGLTFVGARQLDFPLFVGKSWQYTAQGQDLRLETSVKVIKYEKITTTAGSYEAFELEGRWFIHNINQRGTTRYWYAPLIKQIIKLQSDAAKWDTEMISFSIR